MSIFRFIISEWLEFTVYRESWLQRTFLDIMPNIKEEVLIARGFIHSMQDCYLVSNILCFPRKFVKNVWHQFNPRKTISHFPIKQQLRYHICREMSLEHFKNCRDLSKLAEVPLMQLRHLAKDSRKPPSRYENTCLWKQNSCWNTSARMLVRVWFSIHQILWSMIECLPGKSVYSLRTFLYPEVQAYKSEWILLWPSRSLTFKFNCATILLI